VKIEKGYVMPLVTRDEVVEVIKSVKTSTIVTIDAETEIKVPKSNPYYGAMKRNRINGQIGFYYGNAVNNELGREDKPMDFKPQMAKWQKPTDSRNLVTNADETKLYLYIRVLSSGSPTYSLNGVELVGKLLRLICLNIEPLILRIILIRKWLSGLLV
jgi:hypothetical protein